MSTNKRITAGASQGGGLEEIIRSRNGRPRTAKPILSNTLQVGDLPRIPIDKIRINVEQPRRKMPRDLAKQVGDLNITVVEAVQQWAKRTGVSLNLEADVEQRGYSAGSAKTLYKIVDDIALSVKEHGLVEPISVYALDDGTYLLEAGERRTCGYAVLVANGLDEFKTIPAVIAEQKNTLRRQISENEDREGLSALDRARSYWSLRYELSGLGPINWDELTGAGTNIAAQLEKSGTGQLVTWKEVENSRRITRSYRIRVLYVLDLCKAAIDLIEENGFSEKMVKPIAEKLRDDPAGQVEMLQRAVNRSIEGEDMSSKEMELAVQQYLLAKTSQKSNKPAPAGPSTTETVLRKQMQALSRALNGVKLTESQAKSLAKRMKDDTEIAELCRTLRPFIDMMATQGGTD
ncbi:MAG: ParB N-terminal domain-containing protein [Anaerolineae bacterium]|nr:ParB N-terminal domain-containing protein [Anaerolineae bacterium]